MCIHRTSAHLEYGGSSVLECALFAKSPHHSMRNHVSCMIHTIVHEYVYSTNMWCLYKHRVHSH